MYELHSIKQGKQRCSLANVPLVHHGMKFYFRCGEDFYKMCINKIKEKSVSLQCYHVIGGVHCRFSFTLGHSFKTVRLSSSRYHRFDDTVTQDQLLNIANYRFENVKSKCQKFQHHRNFCKINEDDKFIHRCPAETISSDTIGPIPTELQFLLDQPEVAVDITDSCTEFEFTAEEILSGGEQATMIILPNPAFETE